MPDVWPTPLQRLAIPVPLQCVMDCRPPLARLRQGLRAVGQPRREEGPERPAAPVLGPLVGAGTARAGRSASRPGAVVASISAVRYRSLTQHVACEEEAR